MSTMFSTDADGTKRKASTHHRKVGWQSSQERAAYCCRAAEIMLCRPRSATPTMHEQMMRDRHRVREEVNRSGSMSSGRGSPYRPPAAATTVKRHEGRTERSRSSDHHRHSSQIDRSATATKTTKTTKCADEGVSVALQTSYSPLPRSPSPTASSKHRRLDDRDRQGSYVMQYKKYQQQASPRAEYPRTGQPIRPCIKYQPAVNVPQRCHQLLSEMEPALMDEQPLPPLNDHEPYFDSLEEYDTRHEDDRQVTTDAAHQQQVTNSDQSSVDTDILLLPDMDPEPVTTAVATDEASESVEPAAVFTDAESVDVVAETRSDDDDDVPQQQASAETDAEVSDTSTRSQLDDDSQCFLLNDDNVATTTYVAGVPQALSRWTISMSLSVADWTPSHDSELAHTAQLLITQLQTAVDQLTLPAPSVHFSTSPVVNTSLDEEKTLREHPAQGIDELADSNATAAASDVTLTSDVADQQLPAEHQTSSTETDPACEPARPAISTLEGRKNSSGLEEPSSEAATVYIDIIGPFPVCRENKEATSKLQGDETDEKETAEEQKIHEEENLKDDTVDSGVTNTETSQQDTSKPEEMSESELESDNKEGIQLTMDEMMRANVDADLETEVERIEVSESEDDDRDSSSVFNTCDEWQESLQSSGRMNDQASPLLMLNEDSMDCVAVLTEPDDIDKPPMAPRSRGFRREQLQPVPPATLEYSCGDILKFSDDRKSTAKVCFARARGVDRKAGDRPVSYHGVAIQPPRPSKRRPQSAVCPPLGGRIPQHSGLAPPISKGLPHATHAPAVNAHISTRYSDGPATKSTASLQSHHRARNIKPVINMGRKPAWK